MAVLNKIRQRSLVMILVIALALFSFILSDLFTRNGTFGAKSENNVATINGKDISREEFLQKVQVAQRNQPNASTSQIMNSIYNQEVRNIIMGMQYEELGLSIERDQMRDILKTSLASMPEFQNEDGVFDENKLNEFIANLKEISPDFGYLGGQPIDYATWKDYEERISVSGLQQDFFNLVKAAAYATQFEGKVQSKMNSEKRDIRYVQIPFTSIADSTVSVSKSEISDYLKKHSDQYQVEESRNIKFVEFKNVASASDEKAIEEDLRSYLTDKSEYDKNAADSISVRPAFAKVTDNETYINLHSDVKFTDRYLYKTAFSPATADSILNLNAGEVYGPYKDGNVYKLTKMLVKEQMADSIKSSHIIVPYAGSFRATPDITTTKEQAQAIVDSLLPLVKNNKEKFNEVATEINTDGTKANNGEVGWTQVSTYNPNTFDPDYAKFLFDNEAGSVDIVETKFGFHIIRIDEKKGVDTAVKVGTIVRNIEPSEQTEDMIFRQAGRFEVAVSEADFDQVAKDSNYVVRPVNQIKALDENIPGIGSQRQIVLWAFDDENEVGDIKRFDISTGYVIVQLSAKNKKGLMSVDEASVPVTAILRKEKKAEMIKKRISAKTIDDLAASENTSARSATGLTMASPTISGAGNDPHIVGAVFALNEGETSGLLVGDRGVYMVEVTKVEPAVELDNYQSFANQIEQQRSGAVNSKLYQALQNAAEIEDNRAKTVQ